MSKNNDELNTLYTPQLIEFAALGVEFASLVEQGASKSDFVENLLRLLPNLYRSILLLPSYFYDANEDIIEEYISEDAYNNVLSKAEEILGEDDMYLSVVSNEMKYSDTPLALHISEGIADIYQHVGNLLGIIKERNEIALPSAIGRCRLYWKEHWGLVLISILSPLHNIYVENCDSDIQDNNLDTEEDYD